MKRITITPARQKQLGQSELPSIVKTEHVREQAGADRYHFEMSNVLAAVLSNEMSLRR
jgi:hypothetical protein